MRLLLALVLVVTVAHAFSFFGLGRKKRKAPPPPPPPSSQAYVAPPAAPAAPGVDMDGTDKRLLIPNPYNPTNLPPIAIVQNCCRGQPDGPRVIYFPVPPDDNPYYRTTTVSQFVMGPTVTVTMTETQAETIVLQAPPTVPQGAPVVFPLVQRLRGE